MRNMEKSCGTTRLLRNVFFALETCWKFSKKLTVGLLGEKIITYVNWVFFSAIFLKKLVMDLDNHRPTAEIITWVVIVGIIFSIISLLENYIECVLKPLEQIRLFEQLHLKIFDKARNVEIMCYEDVDFYDKYTKAIDKSEEKIIAVIEGLGGSIWGLIALVVVFILLYQIKPEAILFIVFPIIGNFVFANLKNKAEYKRYQKYAPNDKVLNYVNRTMYLADYAKEIRLTNIFNILKRQYDGATDNLVSIAKKYAFENAFHNFWKITFSFTSIFEGMLIYAIYEHLVRHSINIAELTVMTGQMMAMAWILILLFNDFVTVNKNVIFLNDLRFFLEYEEKIPENQDGLIPSSDYKTIEFNNVYFSYKDKEVISNLSFKINKGDMIALVGHNGAGKTTIIKLLLRLYDPTKGAIFLDGVDIRKYNLRAYRELFATTFQDFCIMGASIKDNVLMGRDKDDVEITINEALEKAGIQKKISELNNGQNTMMTKEFDESGIVFSGGENQKIAIARTFVQKSQLKIFDEPSSALDPISEYELFKSIIAEHKQHTMILISHRLSSVKLCDRVIMLENGRIVEEGTHKDLMVLGKKYAEMYKAQARNYLAIENIKSNKGDMR
ncbi:ABC transporter ATP-binding protein [Butyrivibrio sp. M55]|uniref:ABC transporter ATP-binding protein n=1 Tax=Butyrivibrio sp. M55 TaxID=1855323 RepID=UPI0008EF30F3|nr:ABC transporter ATP-binding protein [Butyrivibrio sp. M55]SFU54107.1 ATP-binding cassette, subfamily B [Butyrivibrio sp. M55]